MVLKAILIGGVLPGAVCTLLLLLGWFRTRRSPERPGPGWLMPLLIPLSVIPAEILLQGTNTKLWPVSVTDRMPHIALAVSLVAFVHAVLGRSRVAAWLLPLVAVALADWMFLSFRMRPGFWTPGASVLWMTVFVAGGSLLTRLIEYTASRPAGAGPAIPGILFIVANALPVILVTTGNAYISQICGGVAACLGAALLVAMLIPRFTLARGAITAVAPLLTVMGIAGFYLADGDMPPAAMLLLVAGPVLACVALLTLLRKLGPWKRFIIASVITGLFCGSGVGLVVLKASAKPPSEMSSEYDY